MNNAAPNVYAPSFVPGGGQGGADPNVYAPTFVPGGFIAETVHMEASGEGYDDGYYFDDGSEAQGYYDEAGNWVDATASGEEQGFFDETQTYPDGGELQAPPPPVRAA